ncbi:restriction endonuclease subunit S [Lysinibacillus xylanilyticus]|uniref:restriction endonuclease subunit S n=1 Tax=Lysinibacillus xylanilyticus TaxID=582475 RepID=UPI00381BDC5B
MKFKVVKLSEIATVQTGPFGSQLHKEDYVEVGIPIITVEHLGENKILHQNLPLVGEEDYNRLRKYHLKIDDIVFSRVGSVDRRALVSELEDGWMFSGRCLRVRVVDKNVNPKYLSYYFGTKSFKEYIRSIAVGATMPSINTKILSDIELKIPSLEVQNLIVELLYNIDSKIWNNDSIINKLDEISQLIFKNWFINFEFPNEQGLPYRSSGGEMVESEFGGIPKEWKNVELKTLTTLHKKTFNPKKSELEEVVHFSLPAFDVKNYPMIDKVENIKSNKWIVEENCVLFSKMNPITPRIWVPKVHKKYLNVASSEFVVLRNENFKETAFIYTLCKSEPFIEYLKSNATGSTNSRQRITPDNAMLYTLPLDLEVVNDFSVIVSPLIEQIQELYEEINKLELLRNILLPKLLTGEIEIPDESVVG